jgi:Flp pilus assembly protein TadG
LASTHKARRNKKQKGSSMLETALVLLTLLAMIIFIMDMGRILLMQQFLSERVPLRSETRW